MIRIENLRLSVPRFLIEKEKGTRYVSMPSYVDMFLSNDKCYFNWFYNNFKKYFYPMLPDNIKIGEEYGLHGIPIQELLSREPDDTIYTIGHAELCLLPERYTKPLLENYRVMCIEVMEGGTYIFDNFKNKILEYRKKYNVRDLQEQKAGPMFGLITYNMVRNQFSMPQFKYEPKKLAIVPCHKPRQGRLFMLSTLYKEKLLQKCDWTLVPDFSEKPSEEALALEAIGDGHFYLSPNLHFTKWPLLTDESYKDIQKFLKDHKSQLPKSFDNLTNNKFSDSSFSANEEFIGAHMFNIACETYDYDCDNYDIFITEKCFKAFLYATPCLVYGSPHIEKKLSGYGFKFPSQSNYDHLQGMERANAIVEFLKQDHDIDELRQIAKHNFDLAWNKEFLIKLFADHLVKGQ